MPKPLTHSQIAELQRIDTPTVCNLLEIAAPHRRGHGYTTRHLHCAFPDLPPIVLADAYIAKVKAEMPELPRQKREKFIAEYKLTPAAAHVLRAAPPPRRTILSEARSGLIAVVTVL